MSNPLLARAATGQDTLRQVMNIIATVSQPIATWLVVATGTDGSITTNQATTVPPIVPATYTFAIWGLIYASSLAYAIYQALPAQRTNPLLRKIGWVTPLPYVLTSVWLYTAAKQYTWITVADFGLILISLFWIFIQLTGYRENFTVAQRFLVDLPFSVYTGWVSVAFVANVSTALFASNFNNVLFSNVTWAVIMLGIAGILGATVTYFNRGSSIYAVTLIWTLTGIAVANVTREYEPAVVAIAVIDIIAFVAAWFATPMRRGATTTRLSPQHA